jgi:hypothetical protein
MKRLRELEEAHRKSLLQRNKGRAIEVMMRAQPALGLFDEHIPRFLAMAKEEFRSAYWKVGLSSNILRLHLESLVDRLVIRRCLLRFQD